MLRQLLFQGRQLLFQPCRDAVRGVAVGEDSCAEAQVDAGRDDEIDAADGATLVPDLSLAVGVGAAVYFAQTLHGCCARDRTVLTDVDRRSTTRRSFPVDITEYRMWASGATSRNDGGESNSDGGFGPRPSGGRCAVAASVSYYVCFPP